MCTSITYYTNKHHLFGRNLDLEVPILIDGKVTVIPKNYEFTFRHVRPIHTQYAMIGMAKVVDDFPLYFDAINEVGLGVAGLNFPENAVYNSYRPNRPNIAAFELIPWILCQFRTVDEVRAKCSNMNIIDTPFSDTIATTPLHWMVADKEKSIVIEQTYTGLHIYDNPVGVLTNNPPFDTQLFNLSNYMGISSEQIHNEFSDKINLRPYSFGMGGIGMPGDLSSMSRFVRASFVRLHSISDGTLNQDISQFFHILRSVEQPRGCVHVKDNEYEITQYMSCGDLDNGVYYYQTYDDLHTIHAFDLHKADL